LSLKVVAWYAAVVVETIVLRLKIVRKTVQTGRPISNRSMYRLQTRPTSLIHTDWRI